jgi:hypothetical protein
MRRGRNFKQYIYENSGGVILDDEHGNTGYCAMDYWTVSNNIIVDNGISGTGNQKWGLDFYVITGTHNLFTNNMVYGNLPANYGAGLGNCSSTAVCSGQTILNAKSDSSASVTFMNAGTDTNASPASSYSPTNYQLKSGSNAVNQGTTSCAASPGFNPCTPTTDFSGKARSTIDIGAYAY